MNYESCTFRTLYSFFVVQFSMTGYFSQPPLSQRLCYYITLSRLCQYPFLSFFQLFSVYLLAQSCLSFAQSSSLSQACVLYHLPLLLSIPFLKVFWGFFGFLCFLEFFLAVKAFSVFSFVSFFFKEKSGTEKPVLSFSVSL